jgi:hypothetical protein
MAQSAQSGYKKVMIYGDNANLVDDLEIDIPKSSIKNPDAIAVVIGNKIYQNGISNVDFAYADARIVAKYLEEVFGYSKENIILLEDATLSKFKLVFGDKGNNKGQIYDRIKTDKSDVFVFYSGHGAPDPNDQNAYLMPSDADPNHLPLTGYKLETLYENIKSLPIKKSIFVIDACFSGKISNGEDIIKYASPVGIKVKKPQLINFENTVIITASSRNQIASWYSLKRHGLLTYYFLKGLQGNADIKKDKKIEVWEMRNWLSDKENGIPSIARRYYSREQNPEVEGNDNLIIK